MLEVDLLYFDGCPTWDRACSAVARALAELDLSARVRLRDIAELSELERAGFAGSPTIRVNGRDLEGYEGPLVMARRRYPDNGGRAWPSQALLHRRLRAASASSAPRGAVPAKGRRENDDPSAT